MLPVFTILAALTLKVTADVTDQCASADPNSISYFPVPDHCQQYLECFEGTGNLFTCPSGLWWHQEISDCDYRGTYCDGWTEEICEDADPAVNTFFPFHDDCTKYVECFDEVVNINTCPAGTWWHQEIETCDYPGDYCTADGTTTTTTNSPTTPSHGRDPRCVDDSTNYWSHPALCSRYIECYRGDSYEMSCPPNLFFSELLRECVAADESECCEVHSCT